VFPDPWTTQILAHFGAEVIKLERPLKGGGVRYQGLALKDKSRVQVK
jgi:crotonobetainyl-CoA:carnitine CoA-transferase CaiB-like acyl-CoA transferase